MHPHILGVGWFARRSPNSLALRDFYSDALGLPQLRGRPQSMMFWSGGTTVTWISPGGQIPPEYTDRAQASCYQIYRVHGIEAIVERLAGMGVKQINDINMNGMRLIYFLDPSGNVFGVQERTGEALRNDDKEALRQWESGETTIEGIPPITVPGVQNLGWIVQRSQDTKPVIAFYRDVLKLPVVMETTAGTTAIFQLDTTQGMEIAPGGDDKPRPTDRKEVSNAMILRVRDIDGLVADLKSNGVEFVNDQFESSGRLAYFLDPSGQLVGIQERNPDSLRPEDHEATRRWAAGA